MVAGNVVENVSQDDMISDLTSNSGLRTASTFAAVVTESAAEFDCCKGLRTGGLGRLFCLSHVCSALPLSTTLEPLFYVYEWVHL